MRFSFEVRGRPVTQGSMTDYGHGITHSSAAALRAWRDAIGWRAVGARPDGWIETGPMLVEAVFWMPRPKSHWTANGSGLLKSSAPRWPVKRGGDTDKLCRALLDALEQAGIWGDDSQVVQLHAEKVYHDGAGMLTCTVHRLTEKG